MTKKTVSFILALALLTLCGCQATPEKGVVTSKNDGAYEAALQSTAAPIQAPPQTDASDEPAPPTAAPTVGHSLYTDSFQNADGDMTFSLAVEEPTVNAPLPVLRVRPMDLTGQQAQKIAAALFGDAPVYEYTDQMTRAEIEQTILEHRQFISDWDGMVDYYGGDEVLAQRVKEDFEGRIAALEAAYQTASDDVELALCAWEFHSEDYYMSPDMAASFQDEGHRVIKATATVDGVPYMLIVCNREAEDYRIHNVSVFTDDRLVSYEDLKAQPHGEADPDALRSRVLDIVRAMDIGQWSFVSDGEAAVSDLAGFDGSESRFVLTRSYEGVRTTYHNGGLTKSDEYASNYYYESLTFTFIGDTLQNMALQGPLQPVETVNANVQTLPFSDILAAAATQMRMTRSDYSQMLEQMAAESVDPAEFDLEKSAYQVRVDHAELGLSRVRVRDSATDFYLTPTYTFYGTVAEYDESGQPVIVYYYGPDGTVTDQRPAETVRELAVINAVDGSAIDSGLGY